MKGLTEREKGFEAEFKRNQELRFRVTARRNRLFGLWAAARLGLPPGEEADTYAKEVVAADFEAPGDDDVIGKVARRSRREGHRSYRGGIARQTRASRGRSPPADRAILKPAGTV